MPTSFPFAGAPFGSLTTPASPSSAPTPIEISTAVGSIFVSVPSVTIEFASDLRGPWTAQEHCYVDRLRLCVAPEIDQASATWYYGSVMHPGETAFETETPLEVAGLFARITITNWSDAGTTNKGNWNATTNSPSLSSGVGTEGDFYTVNVAGTTDLDGVNDWEVGDVLVFSGSTWSRLTHLKWHGIVATETLHPDGNANDISTGRQTLTIYGLLYLAERKQITTTIVESVDGAASGEFHTINRGLAFNQDARGEFAGHGNRSADVLDDDNDDVYVFSYQERGADEWEADQAVNYLLRHQNPWPLDARLDDTSGNLEWLPKGGIETDRRTVKAVLDELIQRQRGVGYYVDYDEDAEEIVLHTFSFVDVDIAMPNGTTLEANPNQYSLDFEASFDVSVSELNNTITTKYHKIVIEGEWRTVTCTLPLDPDNDVFAADWTADEQQVYFDGASRESWYAALSDADKRKANGKARQEDALNHVFARFRLSDDWDLLAVDPVNGVVFGQERVFEAIDQNNANGLFEDEDCETWIRGLTINDHLTLRERYDYSGDNIEDETWTDTVDDLTEQPPFRQPFSFVQTNVPRTPTWELLDKIDGDALEAPDKRKWSVHTKAHHDRAAIMLNVSGGHQQFIARDDWTSIGTSNQGDWDAWSNTPTLSDGVGTTGHYYTSTSNGGITTIDGMTDFKIGDRIYFDGTVWRRAPALTDAAAHPTKNHPLDWQDFWVTLTFEMSERAQIQRQLSLVSTGEQERVLRIPVKDCRLDYVLPNTVVGITSGVLQQTTGGGFVRDDRDRMATFARAAAEWYSRERQPLRVGFKQVRQIVERGWLITSIGSTYTKQNVNSVVTAIEYDIIGKQTVFETSYSELDFQ